MVPSLSLKLLWPTRPSRLILVPFCIDVSGRKTLRVFAHIAPHELSRKSVSVSYKHI
ncbi:hypothetical protein M405DRAFT_820020 [Rhizopogon salebrosus TDB-379]|nr:hypothetical protein M405DRAFT_820020 [Rhizopogon salebrosus TDB-379]